MPRGALGREDGEIKCYPKEPRAATFYSIYLFWKGKADDKGRPVTREPKEKGGKEGLGQRVKEEGVLKRQRRRGLWERASGNDPTTG